ncbi:helix-turn-helix domain-containing protein [Bacillus bombysepticus]
MARTIVYSRFVFNHFLAMQEHTYTEMEKTLNIQIFLSRFSLLLAHILRFRC